MGHVCECMRGDSSSCEERAIFGSEREMLLLASTVIDMHDHVSDDDYNSTSNFGKLAILNHKGEEEEER
jgi:hypothetical protein